MAPNYLLIVYLKKTFYHVFKYQSKHNDVACSNWHQKKLQSLCHLITNIVKDKLSVQWFLKLKEIGMGFCSKFRGIKLEFSATWSSIQLSPTGSHFGVVAISNLYHLPSSVVQTHKLLLDFFFFQYLWGNSSLVGTCAFLFGGLRIIFNKACNAYIMAVAGCLF